MSAGGFEYRLLGPMEVAYEGAAINPGGSKPRALLAILLVNHDRVVSASRLIQCIWSGNSESEMAHALQSHVWTLRKALVLTAGPTKKPPIVSMPNGYLIATQPDQLDISRFERLVREARQLAEPSARSARLGEALALWRGPALSDFEDEPWAVEFAKPLTAARLHATEDRFDAELQLAHHSEIVSELEIAVREHPDSERLWANLMIALYRDGKRAAATEAYRRACQALAEWGLEPGRQLRNLYDRVLQQDSSLEQSQGVLRPSTGNGEKGGPVLRIGDSDHALSKPVMVIGRAIRGGRDVPDIDLRPIDSSQSVSRRHAELATRSEGIFIRDLESLNGTYLNGQRLVPNQEEPIESGDQLRFGKVEATLWSDPDTTRTATVEHGGAKRRRRRYGSTV